MMKREITTSFCSPQQVFKYKLNERLYTILKSDLRMQLYQYDYNIGNNSNSNNKKNDSMKRAQFPMNF